MFFFDGFGLLFLIPLAVIGLLVLAIVAVAERREPDPAGRRPFAIYLVIVVFLTLFVSLFSVAAVVSSVVAIGLPEPGFGAVVRPVSPPGEPAPPAFEDEFPGEFERFERFDPNREHIRSAVQSGLVALAAGFVLLFHVRRLRELEAEGALAEGPALRSYQVYLYAVCLVAVLTALAAAASAVFGFVRIVAPGTTGFGDTALERNEGIRQLVTGAFLALAAAGIFNLHWRRASGLRASAQPAESAS